MFLRCRVLPGICLLAQVTREVDSIIVTKSPGCHVLPGKETAAVLTKSCNSSFQPGAMQGTRKGNLKPPTAHGHRNDVDRHMKTMSPGWLDTPSRQLMIHSKMRATAVAQGPRQRVMDFIPSSQLTNSSLVTSSMEAMALWSNCLLLDSRRG